MKFLSVSSIFLWTVRLITAIALYIAYLMSEKEELIQTIWTVQTTKDINTQCSVENESFYQSNGTVLNSINGTRTAYATISESMCIYSGDLTADSSHLGFMSHSGFFSYIILYVLEGLLIPLIQLANLKFSTKFVQLITRRRQLQAMTDKQAIKEELKDIMSYAMWFHGGNLSIVGWVVFWTFIGNVSDIVCCYLYFCLIVNMIVRKV